MNAMKTRLALGLVALMVAGCGTHTRIGTGFKAGSAVRAQAKGPIVDAPGVVIGTEQKVAGKYKQYKLTGTGVVKALNEATLDVAAKLVAKVGPVSVKKDVTFVITRNADPVWAYQFTIVNITDKETFKNKAQLVSAVNGTTTFKLDDGTTSVIAADGQGSVRVASLDFDLVFGKAAGEPTRIGPAVSNPPNPADWFAPPQD